MHSNPEPMHDHYKRSGRRCQSDLYIGIPKTGVSQPSVEMGAKEPINAFVAVIGWAFSTVLMYPVWHTVIHALQNWR